MCIGPRCPGSPGWCRRGWTMRSWSAGCSRSLETLDRPALKALPNLPYVYAQWQRARVAPDYHIEVAGHFYSVPSRLIREIVDVRITAETVEIFHTGKRIASHARSHLRN